MGIAIAVIQLILSLSILVILHEGGHFVAAKFFKTKVEKFYLFFNPWFSLFKFKKGETEYGIGWLPFGGYVKIAGMIDESFDKEQMKGDIQPWEFRAKPAWQRLIIMLGGIIVNIVLGIVIFIGITYAYGDNFINNESVKYGITVDSIGYDIGLRDGDKILSLDQNPFEKFDKGKFVTALILDDVKTIQVEREGNKVDIPVAEDVPGKLVKSKDNYIFTSRMPYKIREISKNSAASKTDLKAEDRILKVNDIPTEWAMEFRNEIKKHANEEVKITVLRNERDTISAVAQLGEDGMLGVSHFGYDHYFELLTQKYTFAESIPLGTKRSWNFIAGQGRAFKKIFQGKLKASDSVGSVISMGKLFGDNWNAQRFWTMTGMLSLLLAFLNLLPIPGLDGGHAVFVLYEMITRRKPSDKVVEIATTIGFFLLIALMVFALGNDIRKLF